ncbi:hypothetical protein [Spongiimicrobium salis]|uniref:hypothetical protein n=1 Tax=Spongiimicrobium salis TaxID=1667022 RepID=UPI00374D01C6
MNTLKWNSILLFFFVSIVCSGQNCKYSKKVAKKAKKQLSEEIVKATKPKALFSKFSQAASASFIKSNKGYYLGLVLAREFGARVDIMKNNPLLVQFQNDSIVTLYPGKDTPGKFTLPVTTEINKPYYKITEEQLELFSSQRIRHIKVYFTSDKVAKNNRGEDDLGTFFDFEVLKERYQSNCIAPANCLLQEYSGSQ